MDATSLLVLVLVVLVAGVVGLVRTAVKLRSVGPGLERDTLVVSQLSVGASTAIVASIAMGLPPLSLSLAFRGLVLGGAVGLVAASSVKSRRLAAARRQAALRSADTAMSLADQIDALELERAQHQRLSLRVALPAMVSKAVVGVTAMWAMAVVQGPSAAAVFGLVGVGGIASLGWDLVKLRRSKTARERIDVAMDSLLGKQGEDQP